MKKITKILLMFVLIISCFAGVVAFAGCKENSKTITNIGLSKEIKTEYKLNEKLDLLDAKLVVTFNDDTQSELTITDDMILGFDTTTGGQKTLTITYQTKEIKVDYVVKEDFNTIMLKTAQNLLNADKFEARGQSYDETYGWYDSQSYTKNGKYFKSADLSSGNWYQYLIYNLETNQTFRGENGSVSETVGDKYTIYGETLSVIYSYDGSATLTEISTTIENGKYVVKYNFKRDGEEQVALSAKISLDFKVEEVWSNNLFKQTYSYTNVPNVADDWYVKEDFNTIMSKTVQNLLNADKFEAKMQRYDESKGWYDYVGYVKNGQYFKEKSPDANYYEMYDLVNNKYYISGKGETDTEYNKFQIYGYALGLIFSINEDTTFTEISTEIRDGKYVVKYDFKQGESSAMQVTAQISLDCKVEHILIENFTKITYSYTNVPDLTWDIE